MTLALSCKHRTGSDEAVQHAKEEVLHKGPGSDFILVTVRSGWWNGYMGLLILGLGLCVDQGGFFFFKHDHEHEHDGNKRMA